MINPSKLTLDQIRFEVERFRQTLRRREQVPVPIDDIIEFELGIGIIPQHGLKNQCEKEAFISQDLRSIFIDADTYQNANLESRVRFSLAHEIGHLVLHRDQISKVKFGTAIEWKQTLLAMDEIQLSWFEKQADEFAGRLLVPKPILEQVLNEQRDNIDEFLHQFPDGIEPLIDGLSRKLCDKFSVAPMTLRIRIEREGLLLR